MAEASGFHQTPPCWPSPHKPDSVSQRPRGHHAMIIYLSGRATGPPRLAATARLLPGVIHPLRDLRPGGPFLLFCLAPHEVCRAPFLAVGAVGSYPAVSPLPPLARRRFVFCDTVCEPGLRRAPHACAWHAALWCPDFPPALSPCGSKASDHSGWTASSLSRAARDVQFQLGITAPVGLWRRGSRGSSRCGCRDACHRWRGRSSRGRRGH